MKFPLVQGTINNINLHKLASLEKNRENFNLKSITDTIVTKLGKEDVKAKDEKIGL